MAGRVNCHRRAPGPASSANTVFVLVTYMMPWWTCGRALQTRRVGHAEDPFQRQARDVRFVDLRHRGIAVAAEVAVVAGPVHLRSDFAILLARLSQEVDPLIVGAQLHFAAVAAEGTIPSSDLPSVS